ncbi:hypothetical protein D3C71_801350 [compost metagenome]
MHHGGRFVTGLFRAGTCAVLATQRLVDIVPARVVAAHVLPARVVDHDALGVGDRHPVLDAALGEAPHHRLGITPLRGGHLRGEGAFGDAPGLEIRRGDHRQHVGRVHQSGFHGLAHAGLHLVDEHAHHEERGDADDQEEPQKDLEPQPHYSSSA